MFTMKFPAVFPPDFGPKRAQFCGQTTETASICCQNPQNGPSFGPKITPRNLCFGSKCGRSTAAIAKTLARNENEMDESRNQGGPGGIDRGYSGGFGGGTPAS